MPVHLSCIEEGHTDKRWSLDIEGRTAVLRSLTGEVVTKFERDDARKRFQVPGLHSGARHFAIAFDEQIVRFAVDPGGLTQIESFLNQSSATTRPMGAPTATMDPPPKQMRITRLGSFQAGLMGSDDDSSGGSGAGGAMRGLVARVMAFVVGLLAAGHAAHHGMLLSRMIRSRPHEMMEWLTIGSGILVGGVLTVVCLAGALRRKSSGSK